MKKSSSQNQPPQKASSQTKVDRNPSTPVQQHEKDKRAKDGPLHLRLPKEIDLILTDLTQTGFDQRHVIEQAIDLVYECWKNLTNKYQIASEYKNATKLYASNLGAGKTPKISSKHLGILDEIIASISESELSRQDIVKFGLIMLHQQSITEPVSPAKRESFLRLLDNPLSSDRELKRRPVGILAPPLAEITSEMPLLIDAWIVVGAIVGRYRSHISKVTPFSQSANNLLRARSKSSAPTMISTPEIIRVLEILHFISAGDRACPVYEKTQQAQSDLQRVHESIINAPFLKIQNVSQANWNQAISNWIQIVQKEGVSGRTDQKDFLRIACVQSNQISEFAIATGDSSFDYLADKHTIYKPTDLISDLGDNRNPIIHEGARHTASQDMEERCVRDLASFKAPKTDECVYAQSIFCNTASRMNESTEWCQKALHLIQNGASSDASVESVLQMKRHLDDARDCFKTALAVRVDYAKAYYNIGTTFVDCKHVADAIECFQEAVELKPDYFEAIASLATLFAELGRFGDATKCFNGIGYLSLEQAEQLNHLGLRLKTKAPSCAIDCFEKAVMLQPRYSEAYFNLGSAFLAEGRVDKAIDCFRRVLDLNPKHFDSWLYLGTALLRTKRIEEAVSCFNDVLCLIEKNTAIPDRLGFVGQCKPLLDSIVYSFRKVLALNGNRSGASSKTDHTQSNLFDAMGYFEKAINPECREYGISERKVCFDKCVKALNEVLASSPNQM